MVPDGYGVVLLPHRPATHLLLELDRGNETHDRLLAKARGYAKAVPRSSLRQTALVLIVAVPGATRAQRAARVFDPIDVPTSVLVWTPQRAESTLASVEHALLSEAHGLDDVGDVIHGWPGATL